jgi:hypothetical protein
MHSTQRLSDKELDDYYKYNEIVDDIEYEMEQLEKEGVDLFDFQLELKMALDKVKSGSFHMVDIYIESLRPRIKAQWDKLGKQPQKRVKRLVSADELKDELEKAKKEQEKANPLSEIEKAKQAQQKAQALPSQASPLQKEPTAQPPQDLPKQAPQTPSSQGTQGQTQVPNHALPNQAAPQSSQGNPKISASVQKMLDNAHTAITAGDKPQLKKLYAELQASYKQASKEEKAEIFKEVQEIHKRLSS